MVMKELKTIRHFSPLTSLHWRNLVSMLRHRYEIFVFMRCFLWKGVKKNGGIEPMVLVRSTVYCAKGQQTTQDIPCEIKSEEIFAEYQPFKLLILLTSQLAPLVIILNTKGHMKRSQSALHTLVNR